MAKKRRRRRPGGGGGARSARAPGAGTREGAGEPKGARAETSSEPGPDRERRRRKEQARRAREQARKKARRVGAARRLAITAVGAVVVVGVFLLLSRVGGVRAIPKAAVQAAAAAKCTGVQSPPGDISGGQHLQPGQAYTYTMHPALFGLHDPNPLPDDPHVYTSPVPETHAVHNLEHSFVLIYYRQSGDGALPQPVVDALSTLANSSKHVIMAPYPNLPSGQALALAAWDKIQECPSTISPTQARTVAAGFIHAFVCTNNSPEHIGC